MHPYRWYPRYPSRTLWFILGAASAALWIKHRERSCAIEGRTYGHCVRQQPIVPAPQSQSSPAGSGEAIPNLNNKSGGPQSINVCQTFSRTIDNIIPVDGWSLGERKQMERWEEEKEKLADFTLKATDAMADMSESTLDTVLATIESLKAKISEHRAQREKQRGQLGEQLEKEKRNNHLV